MNLAATIALIVRECHRYGKRLLCRHDFKRDGYAAGAHGVTHRRNRCPKCGAFRFAESALGAKR